MENKRRRLNRYVADYVVFDLETTGIHRDLDEIIEISAIRVRNHQIDQEYSTLVNPGRHIPAGATAVNGITDQMVKEAPDLEQALNGFLDFIGDDILVGHNIHTFDMHFICNGARNALEKEIENDYIDTLYMARECLPKLSHYKLTDISEYFQISTEGAHRALNDCVMNQKCYEELGKIMQKMKKDRPDILCPKCGSEMVKRRGTYGEFYGCSNYPRCRGTRKLERKTI
ncbi:MAG: DNA polymerase III subunit epsilon [Lachnospiraceae bacterium]|nr:DNA polymerase III subunit epsilon [Lachnospiraceae bacterium]